MRAVAGAETTLPHDVPLGYRAHHDIPPRPPLIH